MRIIVDAMSGDNAPGEIVRGAFQAAAEYPIDITLVGNREAMEQIAREEGKDLSVFGLIETDEVITMEDSALSVVKDKANSSMALGLKALAAGEGDAFVSAGNTGALLAGATLIVRRVKGIQRAAIATVLPFTQPVLLIDSGANITVTDEYLEQFGVMGSIYMEKLLGVRNARVGLLNNGAESSKGTAVMVAANARLSSSVDLNFIGNVEGKDIPFGACDVLVTDGFTGNIALKLIEGMGKFMMKSLKGMFYQNALTKFSALMVKGKIKEMKKDFDASEYGGAPLMGISKPVIKSHGSSDAKEIKNAIRQAMEMCGNGLIQEVAKYAAVCRTRHEMDLEAARARAEAEENAQDPADEK